MFKKTPSKFQLGISLLGALKNEFLPFCKKLSVGFRPFLERYRYPLFGCMILAMMISAAFSFTVLRKEKPGKLPLDRLKSTGTGPNLEGALSTYNELKQIAAIQDRIEILASKKQLTELDSIHMIHAFRQIDSLYNNIKHQTSPSYESRF